MSTPRCDPLLPTAPPPSTSFISTPLFPHPTENCFTDAHNRTIILRGLNVGGCAKVPHTITRTKRRTFTGEEYDEEVVSYTGRPFRDVEEAAEWWRRLRMWGVGVVRWVVTWEGMEPGERGRRDEEYVEYVVGVVRKAGEAGLKVFVDVHQDCWSRFSGGSGAPAWTFKLAGIDPTTFHSTYTAALLPPHPSTTTTSTLTAPYIFREAHLPAHQTPLSQPSSHLWPTNYTKFSCATMFTLFWAGSVFAPTATTVVDGVERNVGDVLQEAYLETFKYLARRLAGLDCVLGWDALNEPHPGYVGLPSLKRWNQNTDLHLGVMPSGVQGMVLASGGEGDDNTIPRAPLKLPIYHRSWPGPSSTSTFVTYNLNDGARVWDGPGKDIWRNEGVWWWDAKSKDGFAWKDDYFTKHPRTGKKVDFERDFYEPFLKRFLQAVAEGREEGLRELGLPRHAGSGQWSFIEPVPNDGPPSWTEDDALNATARVIRTTGGGAGVCYSPHWYDLRACFEKQLSYTLSFDVGALALGSRNFYSHSYFGRTGLLGNYTSQFKRLVSRVKQFRRSGHPTPILVGETGIPFDINDFEAYKSGDVHWQMVMLDSITAAMERVASGTLNWTLWNFTAGNHVVVDMEGTATAAVNKEVEAGDGWNSEDFSLVSRDEAMTEVPYPGEVAGWDKSKRLEQAPEPSNLGTPLVRGRRFGGLYKGARCTGAWVRPYPAKIAGRVLESGFKLGNVDGGSRECWGGKFGLRYRIPGGPAQGLKEEQKEEQEKEGSRAMAPEIARTTEVFLPAYHFGGEVWRLYITLTRTSGVAGGVVSTTKFLITDSLISGVTSLPAGPEARKKKQKKNPAVGANKDATSSSSSGSSVGTNSSSTTDAETDILAWRYSEPQQTLYLIHSPSLAGVTVEVVAVVGVEEVGGEERWGSGSGGGVGWWSGSGVNGWWVVLFYLLSCLGAVVVGSWFMDRTIEIRRGEEFGGWRRS